MQKIKTGDTVVVTVGRSKGNQGKVLKVLNGGASVIVEGANIVKKSRRPNPNLNQPGGIESIPAPLHTCKVAIYNPATGKADRVGFKEVDGRYVRIFKSNQEQIDA